MYKKKVQYIFLNKFPEPVCVPFSIHFSDEVCFSFPAFGFSENCWDWDPKPGGVRYYCVLCSTSLYRPYLSSFISITLPLTLIPVNSKNQMVKAVAKREIPFQDCLVRGVSDTTKIVSKK